MRMSQVMNDIRDELTGQAATPLTIRQEFSKRFAIEDIDLRIDTVKITQSKNGYSVRVAYEEKAPYFADVYLMVAYDKQVEITR
jgi:hypothetical protein